MSKELIERLRDFARDYVPLTHHEELVIEAADRIEELERERDALKAEIAELVAALKGANDLTEILRMPNIEHVADAHNKAVRSLRAALAKVRKQNMKLPELNHGEHYAGLIVGKDGEPSYHLVLLPGEAEKVTFAEANEWAGLQGYMSKASLPTRREQALLYANIKEQFQPAWYWSSEEHASYAGWAWYQYFNNGDQYYHHQNNQLRARAVRRLPI